MNDVVTGRIRKIIETKSIGKHAHKDSGQRKKGKTSSRTQSVLSLIAKAK